MLIINNIKFFGCFNLIFFLWGGEEKNNDDVWMDFRDLNNGLGGSAAEDVGVQRDPGRFDFHY
jgi:hypothetical protein